MAREDATREVPPPRDDWFSGEETSSNDLPRFAIGDPAGEKDQEKRKVILMSAEGSYEDSTSEVVDGKVRLLHQILLREPMNGFKRILLWGNYQLDGSMPCLEPGTKVRVTYKGTSKLKGGRSLKQIKLEFPASAKKRPHPFQAKITELATAK